MGKEMVLLEWCLPLETSKIVIPLLALIASRKAKNFPFTL
jgi:hypothetical protein